MREHPGNSHLFHENWNFGKRGKFSINILLGAVVCWFVPQKFAHFTETLLLMGDPWLLGYSLFYGLVFASSLEVFGCYEEIAPARIRHFFLSLCSGLLAGTVLILSVWFLKYEFVGRYVFLNISICSGLGSYLLALVISKLASFNIPHVFLQVSPDMKAKVLAKVRESKIEFVWVQGIMEDFNKSDVTFVPNQRLDIVVIDSAETLEKSEIVKYLGMGSKILSFNQFWSEFFRSFPPSFVDHSWFVDLDLHLRNPVGKRVKRLLDIIISILGLVFTLPFLAVGSLLILIESGFPIFFTQTRTGFMGSPYTIYKLRTMRKESESNGPKWAVKDDQRITKVGSFLRKWRIDEIPQLWNVLKGEMSLVGPRPERPEFDSSLNDQIPYWNFRTLVKPGLTGWAQIRFNYASDLASSEEKLAYDLYYIKNASLFLDLEILLSTFRSINKGSR
jgi:exopolysaccharide biosynthesis polyprenyl glycosylphosphotransferase